MAVIPAVVRPNSNIVRHPRNNEHVHLPEDVEVEAVLGLVGDGVPDPGEVLPVLPGHPLQ